MDNHTKFQHPPQEFNDWWNDKEPTESNPFRKDSAIYWAWEGWMAAMNLALKDDEDGN